MYRTIHAEVSENGQIILKEPLQITGRRRAVVTILDGVGDDDNDGGNSQQVLDLLNSPEFFGKPQHSPEEIETIINENRNAWGE
ncbi:MAG: hypothetical protein HQL79_10610 [Magnetococcales bacterium]|nr:hypothetical protein [Magnetococcales bacterium]